MKLTDMDCFFDILSLGSSGKLERFVVDANDLQFRLTGWKAELTRSATALLSRAWQSAKASSPNHDLHRSRPHHDAIDGLSAARSRTVTVAPNEPDPPRDWAVGPQRRIETLHIILHPCRQRGRLARWMRKIGII
jgi:hypothetical protein